MKKLLKKISLFSISIMLLLSGFNVKAYDQDITISNNIIMGEKLYSNVQNYVTLNGSLKNDSAVVNQQYVSITKEQFDAIVAKSDANNKYVNEQYKIIEEKSNALKKEALNLQSLKEVAEKEGATQEEIDAYNTALATYNTNYNALTIYSNDVDAQIENNNNEYKKLIPSYNDNNWKKLALIETTDSSNKYGVDFLKNTSYSVSWVKVTLGGNDYYQYMLYCDESIEVKKYYCEIVDGKYYDSEGKEVTEEEYKKDCETEEINICKIVDGKYYDNDGNEVTKEAYEKACIVPENPKTGLNVNYLYAVLIPLVALSSYVVIRKAKKFSR